MLIPRRVLHDLKTERGDIAPPLQPYLRLVPIAFYLGAAASIVLSAVFAFQLFRERGQLEQWKQRAAENQTQLDHTKLERTKLEGTAKRASDFVGWVEGSRAVQPLVVAITRSVDEKSSLTEVGLTRDADNPTQIKLALKLLTSDARQLDRTLEAIERAGFRPYSARQTQAKGVIDYQATLIWQSRGFTAATTPTPAKK
jgi:hypothetical protein